MSWKQIDHALDPAPGMSVVAFGIQRRVTFARNGEVRYVEKRTGQHKTREGGCLLSTWQKWCKRVGAAEEIPF